MMFLIDQTHLMYGDLLSGNAAWEKSMQISFPPAGGEPSHTSQNGVAQKVEPC